MFALPELIFLIPILAIIVIVDTALFSFEQYAWSIFVMLASLVGAYFLLEPVKEFVQHAGLWTLIRYLGIYLLVGFFTAVVKWLFHNLKQVGHIREAKKVFDAQKPSLVDQNNTKMRNLDPLSPHFLTEIKSPFNDGVVIDQPPMTPAQELKALALKRENFVTFYKTSLPYAVKNKIKIYDVDFSKDTAVVDALTPRAKDNVGLITIWIFQWPIVIIDAVFRELLVKLAKNTARILDAIFSHISRKLVAQATKGL